MRLSTSHIGLFIEHPMKPFLTRNTCGTYGEPRRPSFCWHDVESLPNYSGYSHFLYVVVKGVLSVKLDLLCE